MIATAPGQVSTLVVNANAPTLNGQARPEGFQTPSGAGGVQRGRRLTQRSGTGE